MYRNVIFSLQLRVQATKAFGSGVQTAFATVNITVQRNLNTPQFDRQTYDVTIPESLQLGSSVIQLTASDNDAFVSFEMCATKALYNNIQILNTINSWSFVRVMKVKTCGDICS